MKTQGGRKHAVFEVIFFLLCEIFKDSVKDLPGIMYVD